MLHKWLTLFIFLTIFLSACSLLHPKTADSVNVLSSNQQYDEAIAAYNQLSPEQQRLIDIEQINTNRNQYESALISEINQLIKKNQFVTAKQQYDSGMLNIPSSTSLQDAGKNLETKKQAYIQLQQDDFNLIRARFLADEKPFLDKLMLAKGDEPEFIELYNKRQQERADLSESLGLLGLDSLTKKQTKNADNLLKLAHELKPDPRWKDAITQLEKQQKSAINKQKEKQIKDQQLEEEKNLAMIDSIKRGFESAMLSGDLPAAQEALAKINKKLPNDNPWIVSAKIRLDNTIQSSLELALKQGQILYSQGDISQALSVWRAAQRYAPNDKKLNDSIKRAATFEKNLLNLTAPTQ